MVITSQYLTAIVCFIILIVITSAIFRLISFRTELDTSFVLPNFRYLFGYQIGFTLAPQVFLTWFLSSNSCSPIYNYFSKLTSQFELYPYFFLALSFVLSWLFYQLFEKFLIRYCEHSVLISESKFEKLYLLTLFLTATLSIGLNVYYAVSLNDIFRQLSLVTMTMYAFIIALPLYFVK